MRRASFLYVLLLAAPALGVELVRPSAAAVQLSFDFAAPVAAPIAASPISIAPVAMLAPAPVVLAAPEITAAPAIAAAPAPIAAAAPPVAAAPAETGREQLQRVADASGSSNAVFDAPRKTTKMDYDEFGRQVAARPGLSTNPFQHADAKRRILSASGYTHLFGAGGTRVPLAEASDVRVGKAFLSVKKTFDRRNKK